MVLLALTALQDMIVDILGMVHPLIRRWGVSRSMEQDSGGLNWLMTVHGDGCEGSAG